MLHIAKEYEIMVHVTCMPVLKQLNTFFVTEMREMAVYNAFFPEVARCSVSLLLFRILYQKQLGIAVCVSNQILRVTLKMPIKN